MNMRNFEAGQDVAFRVEKQEEVDEEEKER